MHEGDHNILGEDQEHDQRQKRGPHRHEHGHGHDHTHEATGPQQRHNASRLIAGVVVAVAVALFIVWRFL